MPEKLGEVDTRGIELWFPSDLEGKTFYLRDRMLFDASEVRKETGQDTPEFGRWFPVHGANKDGTTTGTNGWICGVGELIEELQDMRPNPVEVPFTITKCDKTGPKDTDPYHVETVAHDELDAQQQGLDSD